MTPEAFSLRLVARVAGIGDDPGALVVLGHIGARAWMGSTAIDLARTTRVSILVARPGAGLPEASDS